MNGNSGTPPPPRTLTSVIPDIGDNLKLEQLISNHRWILSVPEQLPIKIWTGLD
jgi:hypothetical protein